MKSALLLFGNLAPLLSGLLTAPVTARALGPEGRGEITVIVLIAGAIQVVGAIGFPWAARRSIARDANAAQLWARGGAVIGAIAVPLSIAICVPVSRAYDLSQAGIVLTALLFGLSALSALRGALTNTLLAVGQQQMYGLILIVSSAVNVASIFLLAALGQLTVESAVLVNIAAMVVQLAMALVMTRATRRSRLPQRSLRLVLDWKAMRPAWISQITDMFVSRADIILIALIASSSAVGTYSVAALIPQATYAACLSVVQASYAPARFAVGTRRLALVAQTCVLVGISAAVATTPVMLTVYPLLFGSDFSGATEYIPAAAIMSIAVAAIAPTISHSADGSRLAYALLPTYVSCFLIAVVISRFISPAGAIVVLASLFALAGSVMTAAVSPTPLHRVRLGEIVEWIRGRGGPSEPPQRELEPSQ